MLTLLFTAPPQLSSRHPFSLLGARRTQSGRGLPGSASREQQGGALRVCEHGLAARDPKSSSC